MVRKNENPPEGKNIDGDKGVRLNDELEKAGKATNETIDPENTMTRHPIDIRGDVEPEKKG